VSLTREQILQLAGKRTIQKIDVPEWGGEVYIRELLGKERDRLEASVLATNGNNKKSNTENLRARLVVLAVVDENGNRLFSDEDAKTVGTLGVKGLQRAFIMAQRLSGLSDEEIEELTVKLGEDQSADSGSA
jgi:hypothetical protein